MGWIIFIASLLILAIVFAVLSIKAEHSADQAGLGVLSFLFFLSCGAVSFFTVAAYTSNTLFPSSEDALAAEFVRKNYESVILTEDKVPYFEIQYEGEEGKYLVFPHGYYPETYETYLKLKEGLSPLPENSRLEFIKEKIK